MRQQRRFVAGLVLVALKANGKNVPPSSRNPPPNVLLITVNELRPWALGCYMNTGEDGNANKPPTPHMDRLCAAQTSVVESSSAVFWDAHAASPSAAASAASLLLGVNLPVHNLLDEGFGAPEPFLKPLAKMLGAAGYATALVGAAPWPQATTLSERENPMYAHHAGANEARCRSLGEAAAGWLEKRTASIGSSGVSGRSSSESSKTATTSADSPWFLHLAMPGPEECTEGQEHSSAIHQKVGGTEIDESTQDQFEPWFRDYETEDERSSQAVPAASVKNDPQRNSSSMRSSIEAAADLARRRLAFDHGLRALDTAVGRVLSAVDAYGTQGGGSVFVVLTGLVGSSSVSSSEHLMSPSASLTGSHALAVPLLFASWPRSLLNRSPSQTTSGSSEVLRAANHEAVGTVAHGGLATHVDVYATILRVAGVSAPSESSGLSLLHFRSTTFSFSSSTSSTSNNGLDGGRSPSLTFSLASSTRQAAVSSSLWSHAIVTPKWKLAYDPASNEGYLYARRAPNTIPEEAGVSSSSSSSSSGSISTDKRRALIGWESRNNQWNDPLVKHVQTTLLRRLLAWRAQQHAFAGVWQQAGMRPAEGRDVAAARRAGRYTTTSSSSSSAANSAPKGRTADGKKGNRKGTSSSGSSNDGKNSSGDSSPATSGLKLNRAGLPRKARVVDSAFAIVTEALRGVDAELSLQSALGVR